MSVQPAPGWYPDPSGKYELRYWDGAAWTNRVASGGGNQGIDDVGAVPVTVVPPLAPEAGQGKPVPPWLAASREMPIGPVSNTVAQYEQSRIMGSGPSWFGIGFDAFLLALGISWMVEPGWGDTPDVSSEVVTYFVPVSAVVGPGLITFVVVLALVVFAVSLWFGLAGAVNRGWESSIPLLLGTAIGYPIAVMPFLVPPDSAGPTVLVMLAFSGGLLVLLAGKFIGHGLSMLRKPSILDDRRRQGFK